MHMTGRLNNCCGSLGLWVGLALQPGMHGSCLPLQCSPETPVATKAHHLPPIRQTRQAPKIELPSLGETLA